MSDNEDRKKFKDTFNYESIDEGYLLDKDIELETFKLNKVETARYLKFRENHHECLFDKEGHSNFGCSGGGIILTFEPTGLGNFVECKCLWCNSSANITDYDSI